ncbi:MAG: ATP-dependent zinc protease [Candidatus Sericytochromatia bacterium]|nr:ATP-dependent zinc protease [Candidatus Sericytochromatia bacterium]
MRKQVTQEDKIQVGWREWLALPELGISWLEAKIDTGAKTSALHAYTLNYFESDVLAYVSFDLHPNRHDTNHSVACQAQVIDQRVVSDSGGHKEKRYVIRTPVQIAGQLWPIEITLTNRENMAYRMLLGREAMRGRLIVDPQAAYLLGQPRLKPNIYKDTL